MKEQKLSGGMENGVLHEEEREKIFANTQQYSEVFAYIIYKKFSFIHKLKILLIYDLIYA